MKFIHIFKDGKMDEIDFTDVQYWASDMNSDNQVNVIDIVFLVNFIIY